MLALFHFVVNTKLRSEEAFMGRCLFFGIYDHLILATFLRSRPSGFSQAKFPLVTLHFNARCATKIVHAVIS